jgi:hypothetical protein
VRDDAIVWVPAGKHVLAPVKEPSTNPGDTPARIRQPNIRLNQPGGVSPDSWRAARVLDFNGDLESAAIRPGGIELVYTSESRALAKLDRMPVRLTVDGRPATPEVTGEYVLCLPRGKHTVFVGLDSKDELRTSSLP